MPLLGGRKTVTTAGTRVQLPEGHVGQVELQALKTNTGNIAVGGAAVVAAAGSESGILLTAGQTETVDVTDLKDVWIDSTVSGEGVSYLASDVTR
jgi:hypothetical protein